MTVLFVINSLKTGVKERRMLELVKSLKTRYAVHCIIFALNDEVQQSQVHDFGIKLITCKKSFLSRAKAIYTIMRICVEDKPDIINSWCSLSTIISIPGKVLFHKPLVNNQITSAHLEHKRISLGNLGNRAIFLRRFVRRGDFRASGSGAFDYKPSLIPLDSLRAAFETSRELNAQSIAYDFVYPKTGKPRGSRNAGT